MSTKINGFMTLRSEPDAPARSVTSDDVSSWPEIERQLVKACAIFAGDSSVNGRMQAAGQLGARPPQLLLVLLALCLRNRQLLPQLRGHRLPRRPLALQGALHRLRVRLRASADSD